MFELRKEKERDVITSHGEASRYFVTFLDNHDQHERFYYQDPQDPHRYDRQAILGLALPVRPAGHPLPVLRHRAGAARRGGFQRVGRRTCARRCGARLPECLRSEHPFYQAIQELTRLRQEQPALRYGRQYFRPISGDGRDFGISTFPGGVLAFSRILSDQEVLVVANTEHRVGLGRRGRSSTFALNPEGTPYDVLFSNCGGVGVSAGSVAQRGGDGVIIHEPTVRRAGVRCASCP